MKRDEADPVKQLLSLMARLRDPDQGCPWDIRQSFATIAPYTIEEAYEVADAIDRQDTEALRKELGDLLFQVVFHARMAEEQGLFDFDDVASGIVEKMIRRHPHVFADAAFANEQALTAHWESVKKQEREGESATSHFDGVAVNLPSLVRAEKLQKRAASIGLDWPDINGVLDKIEEEIRELREACGQGDAIEKAWETGDLLFSVANLARHLGVDAEGALKHCNQRFEQRCRSVEALAAKRGDSLEELSLAALDILWEEAKKAEKQN